jgi:hypothetical protein
MTLRIPASSIPPDLRYAAADVLADPAAGDAIGAVTLHSQGCLPAWDAFPPYLRYADREAVMIAEGTGEQAVLEASLARVITEISDCGAFNDVDAAVLALDAVDRCFRQAGLWAGNVYLAGAEALRLALEVMGDAPLRRGPEPVLRELAALEVAYLFPVAGKFRSGAYDGQVQYRLNGVGPGPGRPAGRRPGRGSKGGCLPACAQRPPRPRIRAVPVLAVPARRRAPGLRRELAG